MRGDRPTNKQTTLFSVDKVSEGGMGQREAIRLLRAAGIEARPAYSVYVGQSGVEVLSVDKRVVERAERILFG